MSDERDATMHLLPYGEPKSILTITNEGRVVPGPGLTMDEAAEGFLRATSGYVAALEAERVALQAALHIAVGALMLVHAAEDYREAYDLASDGMRLAVERAGLAPGSFTPDAYRRARGGEAGAQGGRGE